MAKSELWANPSFQADRLRRGLNSNGQLLPIQSLRPTRSMLPSLAFLIAAVVLAVTPGPGIAYVVARTAAGGRREGLASCVGTSLGGMLLHKVWSWQMVPVVRCSRESWSKRST